MAENFVIQTERTVPAVPGLGRNVFHDSRSLSYTVVPRETAQLESVRHHSNLPILDQGKLGSCVGNAVTACLGYDQFFKTPQVNSVFAPLTKDAALAEKYAVDVYAEATLKDPYDGAYPPVDTGSDGLTGAKVAQGRGLISGYLHATSLEAVLTALAKKPVIAGVRWYQSMFSPESDGRLRVAGKIVGGHEFVLDELDVENEMVWIRNSWTEAWAIAGRAKLPWKSLEYLLRQDGDVTVFVEATSPAPIPVPPVPPAPPAPVEPQKHEIPNKVYTALSMLQEALAEQPVV